jgi:hypothetical protein|tara:strand:+ start:163 stop:1635 length:1473 start_codon:yes stop_codon:yes gene_type:complete
MPAAAPFFGAIGGFLGFAGATAVVVGAIVAIGTVALASRALKRAKQKKQNRGISGTLITKSGSTENIPVIYGERRIGGHRTFIGSTGSKNVYLHVVESLCEGPIEGLQEIYYNDELVATSSDNGATLDFSAGSTDYSSKADAKFFDGSQSAMISGTVHGQAIHSDWPSGAVGNKVAYIYHVLEWDDDLFASGLPTITYKIKGKKVPALGAAQSSTLTYSNNPARCIYDYLTNEVYGKAIPIDVIDADSGSSFETAETYCAQSVQKTATPSDGNETRYECNGYLETDESLLDNLESLLTSCRGGLITGDKYKLILDKPTTALTTVLNDDNIVGSISFLQANKKTLANAVRTVFPNKEDPFNFQEDVDITDDSTYGTSLQTADGLKLQQDITLNHTTSKHMVKRIATEEINQSRQSGILEIEVDPSLIDLEVGDVVKFSNTTLGQTEKTYRIIQTVLKADHKILLNMREYDNNVYWDNNKGIITNNKDDTDH